MKNTSPMMIGVAGGSGAGKTTISAILQEEMSPLKIERICLDRFFLAVDKLPTYYSNHLGQEQPNFNRPDSLDFEAVINCCQQSRSNCELIILDGHFALYREELRRLMHVKCFVVAGIQEMMERRTVRNLKAHYGGDRDNIFHYNRECVIPMYYEHILPTQKYADVLIPNGSAQGTRRAKAIRRLCEEILVLKKWFATRSSID